MKEEDKAVFSTAAKVSIFILLAALMGSTPAYFDGRPNKKLNVEVTYVNGDKDTLQTRDEPILEVDGEDEGRTSLMDGGKTLAYGVRSFKMINLTK